MSLRRCLKTASDFYMVLDAVREGARRPEFSQNLSRTIVVEGGPTKLECKVSGRPAPDVRWLKDRRSLGDDVSYEMTCEEDELYTLCISATYAEHAGWYSCVARNDVGTAISEAKLTVESMPVVIVVVVRVFFKSNHLLSHGLK